MGGGRGEGGGGGGGGGGGNTQLDSMQRNPNLDNVFLAHVFYNPQPLTLTLNSHF